MRLLTVEPDQVFAALELRYDLLYNCLDIPLICDTYDAATSETLTYGRRQRKLYREKAAAVVYTHMTP